MSIRGKKLRREIRLFLQQYGRKAQKGFDPNDRSYDRKIEALIKRMKPEELDDIMRREDDPD